jgi:hypothetical protein
MNDTDEFLDARPSEDEDVHAQEEEPGGDDDMVFMDEVDAPPGGAASAPATPPARAETRPPGTSGSGIRSAPRPAASPDGGPPGPPGRPGSERRLSESGVLEPPSRVRGLGGGDRPSDSGRVPRPSSDRQAVARPPSGGPRPAAPAEPPGSRTSSGRHPTLARSGTSTSSSGRGPRVAQRPERSPAEDHAALAALEARVQPAPGNDPHLGRELGPFRVERFLGVDRGERRYVATHLESGRTAYVRVFPLVGAYADEFKRVADRAERASRVEAPTLESALAAIRTKDSFYVGFEPPLGPTLEEVLRTEGPLGEDDVLALVDQVARALGPLHGRDLAHGHLSTAVIRRPRPGAWVVEEPGLARPRPSFSFLAAGGDVLGTPGFVAPETVDAGTQTKASDLYSLGCLAWTALVGQAPFTGEDDVQVLLDQLNHEVPPLAKHLPPGKQVSEALQTIVAKLTGYTPDVRYRDVHDLLGDLRAKEKGERLEPLAPTVRPEDVRPKAELRGAATSVLILALLNAGLLALVGFTVLKAMSISIDQDPLQKLEVPLPTPAQPPPGH